MTTRIHEQSPLGRRLTRFREHARLSQEQLAQTSRLSIGIIQKLEQGRATNPRLRTILQLTRALNVSILDLIGEPPEIDSSQELIGEPPKNDSSARPLTTIDRPNGVLHQSENQAIGDNHDQVDAIHSRLL